jgi:hypothetical protein
LASLKHFMANERRDAATIKRGGGRTLIPLDWIESEDSTEFDRSDMLSGDHDEEPMKVRTTNLKRKKQRR